MLLKVTVSAKKYNKDKEKVIENILKNKKIIKCSLS